MQFNIKHVAREWKERERREVERQREAERQRDRSKIHMKNSQEKTSARVSFLIKLQASGVFL